MSTRAFAGTLVGAVVIFLLLGGLSSWLAFFSVIGGAVFLLLAWKELTNARRVACSLVLLWFVLGWVAFSRAESNIAVAKSMTCPANRDYTIGQVLDTVCQRPRWKTLRPEDDGTHFVEFTGKTKKGKVLLQFCVDSDESTAELSYAEFDGTKMSMFEYAAFMNQAYNQYLQKKGR